MSPRTGRPKADNPKTNDVKVRMNDEKHNLLLEYCNKHEITKADAIRKAIDLLLESDN